MVERAQPAPAAPTPPFRTADEIAAEAATDAARAPVPEDASDAPTEEKG
jgi:hypothetical protein